MQTIQPKENFPDDTFMSSLRGELLEASDFIKRKNSDYGNAKDVVGQVLKLFFPNELVLKTEDDFMEFGIFSMMVGKICRFANLWSKKEAPNFESILDTLGDLGNYSYILKVSIKEKMRK